MLAKPGWGGFPFFPVGIPVRLAAKMKPDRGAGHVEILAQTVDKIPDVTGGNPLGVAAHDDKARRPGARLRNVPQSDTAPARGGRWMRDDHVGKPLIQFRRRHASIPDVMRSQDGGMQFREPLTGHCRHRHQRCAAKLRQKTFKPFP